MATHNTASPRFDLASLPVPVIQAPMASGPSTPLLAAAVSEAGGLGFLAAGYKTADAVRSEIGTTRSLTRKPFGVNPFVPQPPFSNPEDLRAYAGALAPDAERFGVRPGDPRHDDDDWDNKMDVLLELGPAVVSFTFDLPESAVISALQERGSAVVATVTSRAESLLALDAGVDALCVQGPEAGGDRGTFDPAAEENQPLQTLLGGLADLPLPLIAAGGIAAASDAGAALALGATAVQAGTAFLGADQAGTKAAARGSAGFRALHRHGRDPVLFRQERRRPHQRIHAGMTLKRPTATLKSTI